jgi:tRNA nucleotidyltransferase (CCA-adding enzyme)
VVVAGSFSRNTALKDNIEFDLFLLFDKLYSTDEIVGFNKKIIYSCFPKRKIIESYSEHPYLQYRKRKYKIDFVPAFEIKDYKERKTAVDRTPLHLKYLLKNLNPKQRDDVLILKQFLKNNLIYGSGQDINGFSGYLCELLILYYRDFENFVLQFSKLKAGARLVLEKDGDKKYPDSLIVIDPTDPYRNVAAALSAKNLDRTKKLCKMFLENPTEEFFFSDPQIKLDKTSVFKANKMEKNDDILYGYVTRKLSRISSQIESILSYSCFIDKKKIYLIFCVESEQLPDYEEVGGPKKSDKENAIKFEEKHKQVFERDGRLFAKKVNQERDVKKLILEEVKKEFVNVREITNPKKIKDIKFKKKIEEAQGLIKL